MNNRVPMGMLHRLADLAEDFQASGDGERVLLTIRQ